MEQKSTDLITMRIEKILITPDISGDKLRCDFRWQRFIDRELGAQFCITPAGEFLELPMRGWKSVLAEIFLCLKGLNTKNLTEFDFDKISANDVFSKNLPANIRTISKQVSWVAPSHDFQNFDLVSSAETAVAHYKEAIQLGFLSSEDLNAETAFAYCTKYLTTKHNEDCLYTSLNQFGFLTAVGLDPTLWIGSFIPVRKMHAWVQLKDEIMFDDIEEVKHFVPMLEIRSIGKN